MTSHDGKGRQKIATFIDLILEIYFDRCAPAGFGDRGAEESRRRVEVEKKN